MYLNRVPACDPTVENIVDALLNIHIRYLPDFTTEKKKRKILKNLMTLPDSWGIDYRGRCL